MMRTSLCLLAILTGAAAFAPLQRPNGVVVAKSPATTLAPDTSSSTTALFSTDEKEKTKSSFDEGLRNKLVSESIAPWRTVRLFMYGSMGSGALVGGLITLTGTVAALSAHREDFNLNTELLNLGIDFGAVAIFALLAKWDLGKQKELSVKVEDKIVQKREQKQTVTAMRQREQQLGTLALDIQIGPDGSTRQVSVKEVQAGASQHMIIVAGPKKACKDALVGANLLKMDFAMSNVLVVPYETGVDETEKQSRPEGGFADRPMYETQPYVGQATGDGWESYIQAELKDAVEQNGESAKKEGIAIVVASNGKVLRRGVGTVPWRQMVEQLEEEAKSYK